MSWTIRGIVHLKKPQIEASLSIISLLTDLQPVMIITNPNRRQFLHRPKSSAAPTDWHLCITRRHSLLLLTASISPLIISNHFHSNDCSVYDLYHLLSRLLLVPIVSTESTVIIYYSYCTSYDDFYCLTQGKKLFISDKVCACFLVFTLFRLRNLPKSHLLLSTEFENLLEPHFLPLLSLRISQNLSY